MDDEDTRDSSKQSDSQKSTIIDEKSSPSSSLAKDEDNSMDISTEVVKRKRLIIEDDDSDEDILPRPDEDSNSNSESLPETQNTSIKRKTRIIDEDDSDDHEEDKSKAGPVESDPEDDQNSSKKVMRNLKSLCDEESSSDEDQEKSDDKQKDTEDRPRKGALDSSSEDSSNDSEDNNEDDPSQPIVPKEKNPQRKAKTEAENVISMIQKNAREDELAVPYHCPEQKSLKDFLATLRSTKAKLVVEEKVEIKTHKFKLLKDVPQPLEANSKDESVTVEESNKEPEVMQEGAITESEAGSCSTAPVQIAVGPPTRPQLTEGPRLTLKGDPNSMIDLETGQTFVKKTVADTLISSLMRHNRGGIGNDPKFKPEPIPGAPLKQLKRNLECELERKRAEMIQKIMKVEKDHRDEEEEILSDDEFELDSDDDTKKKKVKRTKDKTVEEKAIEFNDDEEMEERTEVDPEADQHDQDVAEDDGEVDQEEESGSEDGEEEEEESGSDGQDDVLDTSDTLGKKRPLKRIVAMDDSDDEQQEQEVSQKPQETETPPAPLFEDIPTESAREFSATQIDNELFDLCSGTFTTQLPTVPDDDSSQVPLEASQVRGFEYAPALTLEEDTVQGETQKEPEMEKKSDDQETEKIGKPLEDTETDAIPPATAFNLSSSEDEKEDQEKSKKQKRKLKKKKRIFIQEDSDSEGEDPMGEEEEEEDDGDLESDDDLPEPAIEELEEYKSFLTGKPTEQVTTEKQKRIRVGDFIDKEAELSDSEWGSEDEDERGLDQMEDIGLVKDDENFDGEELRDEVGRIHMRQMVNEDNRELKYLKDLILNEEEADGQGRQRTFRWQNVNNENDDFNASGVKVDGEAGDEHAESDEDENEANWRKIRLEREQALLENKQNVTIKTKFEEVMRQSRTIKVVKPTSTGEIVLKENSSPSFLMQDQSKKYMNLRQSFLLRDEETLNRLATISAKADGPSAVSDGKQNFVFRRLEEKPISEPMEPPKKRKSNGFPNSSQSNPVPKKARKV